MFGFARYYIYTVTPGAGNASFVRYQKVHPETPIQAAFVRRLFWRDPASISPSELLRALEEPLTPEEPSLRVPGTRCPPLEEDAG